MSMSNRTFMGAVNAAAEPARARRAATTFMFTLDERVGIM